jgi:hypothetical protein
MILRLTVRYVVCVQICCIYSFVNGNILDHSSKHSCQAQIRVPTAIKFKYANELSDTDSSAYEIAMPMHDSLVFKLPLQSHETKEGSIETKKGVLIYTRFSLF